MSTTNLTTQIPSTQITSERLIGPRWLPMVLALGFGVLFLAGLYFVTGFHEHPSYPAPGDGTAKIVTYFGKEISDVRTSVFLSVAAELFLGAFTVLMSARLRAAGSEVAARAVLFAGFAVAFLQLSSHLAEWAVTFPGLGQGGTLAAYYLSYGLGGPAFSLTMGFLVGLIAFAGRRRGLPGWIVWSGFVIFLIGLISWGNLLSPEVPFLTILIPLTRFPSLLWLVLAAATFSPARRGLGANSSPARRGLGANSSPARAGAAH